MFNRKSTCYCERFGFPRPFFTLPNGTRLNAKGGWLEKTSWRSARAFRVDGDPEPFGDDSKPYSYAWIRSGVIAINPFMFVRRRYFIGTVVPGM